MRPPAEYPNLHLTLHPNDAVDLHLHTTYSDGHWQPEELFDHLAERALRLVAITDHDRVDRVAEMQTLGAARGIHVLAGVEVTTHWRGQNAHLLCYAHNFHGDALAHLTQQTAQGVRENTLAVHAELARRGFQFPRRNEILSAQKGEVKLPIDNARLLLGHGYAPTQTAALEMIADAGYHIVSAPLADAVEAAHASGAAAVLAHPGRGGGEIIRYEPADIAEIIAEVPLDGVEVYYPLHTAEQVAAYLALAEEQRMIVSAGSDSHGPRQRLPIVYPALQVAALLAHCGIGVE